MVNLLSFFEIVSYSGGVDHNVLLFVYDIEVCCFVNGVGILQGLKSGVIKLANCTHE